MRFIRLALLAVAALHAFPIRRHLPLLVAHATLGEAWKAVGACVAVVVLCMPTRTLAATITRAARTRPWLLGLVAWTLVAAHLVPAVDHVPAFLAHRSFADAWRGFGATLAAVWFSLTYTTQVRFFAMLARRTRRLSVITSMIG
jgi:hypothetical protein